MFSSSRVIVYAPSFHSPDILVQRLSSMYPHLDQIETEQQLTDLLTYDASRLNGKDLALELADTLVHMDTITKFGAVLVKDIHIW